VTNDGFDVDTGVLRAAADGISDTVRAMETIAVDDISGPVEQYGHDDLGAAFDEFSERWQYGVEVLTTDGSAISEALRSATRRYAEVDRRNAGGLGGG
jgi:hypothetical protein